MIPQETPLIAVKTGDGNRYFYKKGESKEMIISEFSKMNDFFCKLRYDFLFFKIKLLEGFLWV